MMSPNLPDPLTAARPALDPPDARRRRSCMASDPLLDLLSRTVGDSYRKGVDLEDNVWRSLPFFAATLAFELNAVAQLRGPVEQTRGWAHVVSIVLLIVAASCTLFAVVFLLLSMHGRFQGIGEETELLAFGLGLRLPPERGGPTVALTADAAAENVQRRLLDRFAKAATHNAGVRKAREDWRLRAGIATLASILLGATLVAVVFSADMTMHRSGVPAHDGSPGPG